MTFDAYESSREGGRPVELFQFALGNAVFAYTSAEQSITALGQTFSPEPITRGQIATSPQERSSQLEVQLPATNAFARLFSHVAPGERVTFTLYRLHLDDLPTPEVVTLYKGFVSTVAFEQGAKHAKVLVRPLSSATGRQVPRQTFQNLCNNMLFDDRCGLLEANFEELGNVTAVSDRQITLGPSFSNIGGGSDYWQAGHVDFGDEFRLIVGQTADVLTLNLPFSTSPLNQQVRAVPGCRRRFQQDCTTKFANSDNYNGWPYVPTDGNVFEKGLDL